MRISIGEMSKLHDVSIYTLRYYDKIGLLVPSEVDVQSNYRYYDEYDCHKLGKIKVFKSIGLPLEEMKLLLEGNIEETEEAFAKIREELLAKISNLNEVVYYLEDQLRQIEDIKNGNCYNEPTIVSFPAREGYIIQVSESSSLVERIEAIVQFEKKNHTNADVFFRPSRLMNLDINGEPHLKNYLALRRGLLQGDSQNAYLLEKGNYGVIDHLDHSKNIIESYKRLLEYIHNQGHKPQNQSIEVLVINSNLTENVEEWRTQIQIPIEGSEILSETIKKDKE